MSFDGITNFFDSEEERSWRARQQILDYLAQHQMAGGGGRQNWFSRHKKIILIVIAIILCAAAVFGGVRIKNELIIYKLNQKGEAFLEANSLAMIFEGQMPLPPLLAEHKELTDEIKDFENGRTFKKLVGVKNKLSQWREKAISAKSQQLRIETLFDKLAIFEIEKMPKFYPMPVIVEEVDGFEARLKEIQQNFIVPSNEYMLKLQEKLRLIAKYNARLEKEVADMEQASAELEDKFKSLTKPKFFDAVSFRDYLDLWKKAGDMDEQRSFLNAAQSPRKGHSERIAELLSTLTKIETQASERIEALKSYKTNAESFADAFELNYQLAAGEPNETKKYLGQLELLAASAKKFWPGNPDNKAMDDKLADVVMLASLVEIEEQLARFEAELAELENIAGQQRLEKINQYQSRLDDLKANALSAKANGSLSKAKKAEVKMAIDQLYKKLDTRLIALRSSIKNAAEPVETAKKEAVISD